MLLQYTKIIKFSIIPSAIAACIGTIILDLTRIYNNALTVNTVIYDIVIHILPFILLPLKFTAHDLYINIGIMIIYLVFLYLNNINLYTIFKETIFNAIDVYK